MKISRVTSLTLLAAAVSVLPLQTANAMCPPVVCAAGGGHNFSSIGANVTTSISMVPGLLSALSYMFALLLGASAIIKIKDHVENPAQTPIKAGAVRLLAGGALFALPIIYEAMFSTIGDTTAGTTAAALNRVAFNVN